MSLLPAARLTLDRKLDDQQTTGIYQKVANIKGVLSASFNQKAREITVTYTGGDFDREVRKIRGISKITPLV